jgi:Ankyrin repeats (many copies)
LRSAFSSRTIHTTPVFQEIDMSPRFASVVVAAALSIPVAWAQPAKSPTDAEIEALIDRLKDVDQQDTGYSASMSGSSFLPLDRSEIGAALLFQAQPQSSSVMKSLVKLGLRATPMLLKHLGDDRKTKIEVGPVAGNFWIVEDPQPESKAKKPGVASESKRRYTMMVGDLCYVVLGQIVNRPYAAVRYIPSGNTAVTSVPRVKKLRQELVGEWSGLTPERHLASLKKDMENGEHESASLRLAYWYPDELEPLAIRQLTRPAAPGDTREFVREQLYAAETSKERKRLVDGYAAKHGPIAGDAIRYELFRDLSYEEANEQDDSPDKVPLPLGARECLTTFLGYPKTVKSKDGLKDRPLTALDQADLVGTLLYDDSAKLDRVVAGILAKSGNGYMGHESLKRLFGRGFDNEIEAYLKRIGPTLSEESLPWLRECEAKLGWTRIHAAVELGLDEMAERAIRSKAPIDAKGRDGRTALHLAAIKGHADIVRRLLDAGADRDVRDANGRTPLDLAKERKNAVVIRSLETAK